MATFSKILIGSAIFLFSAFNSFAQTETDSISTQKFPLVVGIKFQNFSLPFMDLLGNLSHPGLFVGTEISYNKSNSIFQQGFLEIYRNREMGNGIHLYTQIGYRHRLEEGFFVEFKGGAGYLFSFHPVGAYRFNEGKWERVTGGRSQITIPLELTVGNELESPIGKVAPFFSYQVTPALLYNKTLPFNIYTSLNAGVRIYLNTRSL